MADSIQKFKLPRLDWYDQEGTDESTGEIIGRIYKDALIENFNAIEEKSLELQRLDVLNISIPEPEGFIYNDSNLEDSNDNQVINLKSFVEILDLNGYPLKLSFDNNVCTECVYYKNVFTAAEEEVPKLVTLKNINTGASNSNPYIFLDIENDTLISSNNSTADSISRLFIGMYTNNKVIHMRSPLYPSSSVIKGV